MSDNEIRKAYPLIEWDAPIEITILSHGTCIGCRLCIAKYGLSAERVRQSIGWNIPGNSFGVIEIEDWQKHQAEHHPI